MKQLIRRNVFESNSSSTHTITISTKTERSAVEPLVDGFGRLLPASINSYEDNYSDACILFCDTRDKKFAWVATILPALKDEGYINEELYNEFIQRIKDEGKYSDVFYSDDFRGRAWQTENDYDVSFCHEDEEENREMFDKLISTCLNDNLVISDNDM